MNSRVTVRLNLSAEQAEQLRRLQAAFAEACNFITPMVVQTRCWNRVGLHHLAYRPLREKFAWLGSQMACNAIYSVSRACRAVYQEPSSKWFVGRKPEAQLPLLRFPPTASVFFDRHTLSIKAGQLSMFTLDGRLKFQVSISRELEARFATDKLREVVLISKSGEFSLRFSFGPATADAGADVEADPALVVNPMEAAA